MKLVEKLFVAGLFAALAFAAPAAAQECTPKDDQVALHYFRPDGSYAGWGLHTWESFQKKEEASDEFAQKEMSDRPLANVNWGNPMKPTGKDDFGICWVIPAKEYENGRVNYIIHKGDSKDQCKKDMFWMIKDSKEAWVNTGDCKVYLKKEDALKARK